MGGYAQDDNAQLVAGSLTITYFKYWAKRLQFLPQLNVQLHQIRITYHHLTP